MVGVRIIQHRFKTELIKIIFKKQFRSKIYVKDIPLFIVNDKNDIALASNADGIHLGQEDLDLKTARKPLGFSKLFAYVIMRLIFQIPRKVV